jgi:hypothetical protein
MFYLSIRSVASQGHLLLLFLPHPPARKEEGERGVPAPRQGAAAPLTPACGEHKIVLVASYESRGRFVSP